jgi:spore maturation protein B
MTSDWVVPALIAGILSWGLLQGTPVYDSFLRGAGRGIKTAVSVLPCLVAVMVAVATLPNTQLFLYFDSAASDYFQHYVV